MGWIALLLIGGGAALLLWRIGIVRELWAFVGAAMMLGATGYALQGKAFLPGHPVEANATPIEVPPGMVELRGQMLGRFDGQSAFLMASDGLTRSGDPGGAARLLLSAIGSYPRSVTLWVGLGGALATHDGTVSPAARFAFERAAQLAPRHPAPPFFLGLAYVETGQFAAARPFWARALALTPSSFSYRSEIEQRLALLDRYLAEAGAAGPAAP